MLTAALAHAGAPLAPHDLWAAWNADPLLAGGLLAVGWLYWRGRRGRRRGSADGWRDRCFAGALAALAVALLSPLDALSGALASAHMVQHVLLVLVAAPLLALSAPSSALLGGSPAALRPGLGRMRRAGHRAAGRAAALRHPAALWLAHVGILWVWHAAALYDAAVRDPLAHAAEHVSFLVTGVLLWHIIVAPRSRDRVPAGLGVLLVFALALQSTFLSVLLTFSRTPWYSAYAGTTAAWGLDPLADQQLAGVIMWVPAGFAHLAAGLGLLAAWLRQTDDEPTSALPSPP